MFQGHQSCGSCEEGKNGYSLPKKVSEYNQEIPQSQTANKPMHRKEEPHNHLETTGRQTKHSNQLLSLPHQDDCKTRMDIK